MLKIVPKPLPEQVMKYPATRYMGSKSKLLPQIWAVASQFNFDSVVDLFSGSGIVGYDGPDSVQVTVTISGGQIVGATYFSYDDEEYVDTAWAGILGQVMGKQSADSVDTVSGCTYSSQGIIQAFRNALNQAKGA